MPPAGRQAMSDLCPLIVDFDSAGADDLAELDPAVLGQRMGQESVKTLARVVWRHHQLERLIRGNVQRGQCDRARRADR